MAYDWIEEYSGSITALVIDVAGLFNQNSRRNVVT